MKTATENLENDHVYILRLTEVLMRMANAGDINTDHLGSVISVIKNFADGLHHAKEENLLFPKLAEKGFSPTQGPVAVMLHEHVEGRNFVKGMSEGLSLLLKGDNSAKAVVVSSLTGYATLLQNHIAKENNVLFRMADNVLSAPEQEELVGQFEKVENSRAAGERADDYISLINKLSAAYNV